MTSKSNPPISNTSTLGSDFQRLAAALYRSATDSSAYDQLFMLWLQWCDAIIAADAELSEELQAEARMHLQNAGKIYETLSDLREAATPYDLEQFYSPTCLIDGRLQIVAANRGWDKEMPPGTAPITDLLSFLPESAALLERIASRESSLSFGERVMLSAGPQGEPFTLERLPGVARGGGSRLVLSRVRACYSPALAKFLQNWFGLSGSEAEVVRGLIEGQSAAKIAIVRKVQPSTVQSQVKAIGRKTGTKGRGGLMALLAQTRGVPAAPPAAVDDPLSPVAPWNTVTVTKDTAGRRLEVVTCGAPEGRAVVFPHVVTSARLSGAVHQAAQQMGLRLISLRPRPSDPEGGSVQAPSPDDIRTAVDALGLERFGLITHSSGAPSALAFAAGAAARVRSVVLIDVGGPPTTLKDFLGLTPVSRLGRFTARVLPEAMLLPMQVIRQEVLALGGLARDPAIERHLALAAEDLELMRSDPQMNAAMRGDICQTYADPARLIGAHRDWSRDWSDALASCASQMPVFSFVGEKNPNFAEPLLNQRLVDYGAKPVATIPDTAYLSLHVAPETVLAPLTED